MKKRNQSATKHSAKRCNAVVHKGAVSRAEGGESSSSPNQPFFPGRAALPHLRRVAPPCRGRACEVRLELGSAARRGLA